MHEGARKEFQLALFSISNWPLRTSPARPHSAREEISPLSFRVRTDANGQPIGWPLADWRSPPRPARAPMIGGTVRLEPIDADKHAADLHEAFAADGDGRTWTYMPYGPFVSADAYAAWMRASASGDDPLFFALIDATSGKPLGVASYLRIDPAVGAIEVGHIAFSPRLRRARAATEAMYLMMANAFRLGYRRYEWKCDALNEPSRRAAQRLGFSYEGVFRQATVYKSRNRDTAWFAITDGDWEKLRGAFAAWLDPANFDAGGKQRRRLSDLTRPLLVREDDGTAGASAGDHR